MRSATRSMRFTSAGRGEGNAGNTPVLAVVLAPDLGTTGSTL
jgi:hypothetical protein